MHKINGYALSENYETLDLFISSYKNLDEPHTFLKQDAESSINQVEKFFKNAVYKDYLDELEETSEVFDLAHTLSDVKEIEEYLSRVNIIVLTNGIIKSKIEYHKTICGYSIFARIIDLEYLFNLIDKSRVPIEINFKEYGNDVYCIKSPSMNEDYESYLALIPGISLAKIYEEYGSRLLEQNVRSFLQFTGKINKGIRKTIKEEPHMFLAYNNGIAATTDEMELEEVKGGYTIINSTKNFQIVNGGQTTASIYHTWKKDKADISNIYVQTKITVVKNPDNYSDIVGYIAEYANTQNKVRTSDLSSNKPFYIELEKLSRSLWTQPTESNEQQTRWFYERARGQFKNARNKEGFTKSKRKAFDLKNPRSQVITKEQLAKYINCYQEVEIRNKLVIGPHIVVRGSQKNYIQFLNYNMPDTPDKIFFEDLVAKAILFKTAEKLYGVNPNAIGDMRYITVPYSIAYMSYITKQKLDLFKIWKNQELSDELKEQLYLLMEQIEDYIKKNAPGSLYGEWAKKEECWSSLKKYNFAFETALIKKDLITSSTPKRKNMSNFEVDREIIDQEVSLIKSITPEGWEVIEKWGKKTNLLNQYYRNIAMNIAISIRTNRIIDDNLRIKCLKIIEIVANEAPDLLEDVGEIENKEQNTETREDNSIKITPELVKKMVEWDSRAKILSANQRGYLSDYAYGLKKITDFHAKHISVYFYQLQDAGFK
jgi:hypothetical protein